MNGQVAITTGARRLRYMTMLAMVLTILLPIAGFLATLAGWTDPNLPASFHLGAKSQLAHWLSLAILTLTLALFAYALWRLSCMLRCVERGEVFTRATINHLRAFGLFVFLTSAATITLPALALLAVGLIEGISAEHMALSFDGHDIFMLIVGGFVFFVARLLDEAQRLADENRLIV